MRGKTTIAGVAEIFGCCEGHAYVITRHRYFPAPSLIIGRTKFWQTDDVRTFAAFRTDGRRDRRKKVRKRHFK